MKSLTGIAVKNGSSYTSDCVITSAGSVQYKVYSTCSFSGNSFQTLNHLCSTMTMHIICYNLEEEMSCIHVTRPFCFD